MMDLFLTNMQLLSSQDINWWTEVVWITCGLLWCFYQLFGLSFWRHPFTAEDPLVSKWWNARFLQIWWRNKLIYILDGLRVRTFSANFLFWVNYSFNLRANWYVCLKNASTLSEFMLKTNVNDVWSKFSFLACLSSSASHKTGCYEILWQITVISNTRDDISKINSYINRS